MRLVGILCLVLASTGTGLYAAARLRREVGAFEALLTLLTGCAAYLRCQRPEIGELLGILSEDCGGRFRFLTEVRDRLRPGQPPPVIWRQAVGNDPAVPKSARPVLYSLGEVLGTTDVEGQLAAIALHQERLSRAAAESRERCERQGKLFRSLGLLGGAMLAVLLL